MFSAYVIIKVERDDFTRLIFGEIGNQKQEETIEYSNNKQYIDVAKTWKQQNNNKENVEHKRIIATSTEQLNINKKDPSNQINSQKSNTTQSYEKIGSLYKYTDNNGEIFIVDDLEKIPNRYKSKTKERTSVTINNNQILVPVLIKHQGKTIEIKMILDTGCTQFTITPEIANILGINQLGAQQGKAKIADGSEVPVYFANADSITVGPKTKRNVKMNIVINNKGMNLLGMEFLGDFPHMINTKSQEIVWM